MSFSSEVKEELSRHLPTARHCQIAETAAILSLCGQISEKDGTIRIQTENAYVARTYKDAPNVDGLLFVNTSRELLTGDFVKVRITGSYEYDLIGELVK